MNVTQFFQITRTFWVMKAFATTRGKTASYLLLLPFYIDIPPHHLALVAATPDDFLSGHAL